MTQSAQNFSRTPEGHLSLQTANYAILIPSDRPYAQLRDKNGTLWTELFLAFSAHTLTGQDRTARIEQEVLGNSLILKLPDRSAKNGRIFIEQIAIFLQ